MDKAAINKYINRNNGDISNFEKLFLKKDECEKEFRKESICFAVKLIEDYCHKFGYDTSLLLNKTSEDYYWILAYTKPDLQSFTTAINNNIQILIDRYYIVDKQSDYKFIKKTDYKTLEEIFRLNPNQSGKAVIDSLIKATGINYQSAVFSYNRILNKWLEEERKKQLKPYRDSLLEDLNNIIKDKKLENNPVFCHLKPKPCLYMNAILYYAMFNGLFYGKKYAKYEICELTGFTEKDIKNYDKWLRTIERKRRHKNHIVLNDYLD